MPAALVIGLVLLLVSLGVRASDMLSTAASSQPLNLVPTGTSLRWVAGEGPQARVADPDSLAASLTPFFFAPVPINTASADLLTTLPGIGPGLAGRIVRFRNQHGPLNGSAQMLEIPGIGPRRLSTLAPLVSFQ